jgi:hypothetical protein
MKRTIIFSLLATLMFVVSCRKDDNPKIPDLVRVPLPLITKEAGSEQIISAQDPNSFKGKFTVDVFFKDDIKPQKYDVVAIKNGNKSKVVTIKENVTTFPTTVEITGAQLASLFGEPVKLGDQFDFSVNITTQNGETLMAFPTTGNAYASGVASQGGASTLVRYEAVCKYDPEVYQGDFVVVSDEWLLGYSPGTTVQLTKISNTQFSFKQSADDAKPVVVTVNPANNSTSVAKQVYGKYNAYPQFGDFSVNTVPSLNNFVAPCEGTVSLVMSHTVSAGSFGDFRIVLKKK